MGVGFRVLGFKIIDMFTQMNDRAFASESPFHFETVTYHQNGCWDEATAILVQRWIMSERQYPS